jgi:hypothetical protein
MAIPSILVALALGFFASACTSKNSKPPRTPRPKPKNQDPEFQHNFGRDLQAKWIQDAPLIDIPNPAKLLLNPMWGKRIPSSPHAKSTNLRSITGKIL